MKVVAELKKKHRNSLWRDDDGDVWFFNRLMQRWELLSMSLPNGHGGVNRIHLDGKPGDNSHTFRRIHKWGT